MVSTAPHVSPPLAYMFAPYIVDDDGDDGDGGDVVDDDDRYFEDFFPQPILTLVLRVHNIHIVLSTSSTRNVKHRRQRYPPTTATMKQEVLALPELTGRRGGV